MLGAKAHLQAVDDHLAHGDFLKGTSRADPTTVGWAITALFYAALHAVRAYLKACKNLDVTSHEDFSSQVRAHPELRRSQKEYDWLKQESQSARYYGNRHFTWADFDKIRPAALKVIRTWVPKAEGCLPTSGSSGTVSTDA